MEKNTKQNTRYMEKNTKQNTIYMEKNTNVYCSMYIVYCYMLCDFV